METYECNQGKQRSCKVAAHSSSGDVPNACQACEIGEMGMRVRGGCFRFEARDGKERLEG